MGVPRKFKKAISLVPIIKDKIADELNFHTPGGLPEIDLYGNLVSTGYLPIFFRQVLHKFVPYRRANVWVEMKHITNKMGISEYYRSLYYRELAINRTKKVVGFFRHINSWIYDEKTIELLFKELDLPLNPVKKVICVCSCEGKEICHVEERWA
jgi:hypothetical protein